MPAGGQLTIGIENVDTSGSDGIAQLTISHQDANELAVLLPGRYVVMRITDTGTGMETWPGESLQVIGKPYSRAALLTTVSRLLGTSVRGPDPE